MVQAVSTFSRPATQVELREAKKISIVMELTSSAVPFVGVSNVNTILLSHPRPKFRLRSGDRNLDKTFDEVRVFDLDLG